jgi:hypothetical protein
LDRRLARVRISKAAFSEMLKYRDIKPGHCVTSSLPDDAEVLGVWPDDTGHDETFVVILHSDLFPEVGHTDEVPFIDITFKTEPLGRAKAGA